MLKIYATTLSANGRKVLAVSRQLGLNPEIHDVNVYRGEGWPGAFHAGRSKSQCRRTSVE
jgi:hypothetical protein